MIRSHFSKEVKEVDEITLGEEQADSTERGEVRLTKVRKIEVD